MGLRCLLGHEYANREVEREREERGDEVVVTYRTVETCERCGERRIVSENKEVRPVRNPADETVATGLGGTGGVTPDPDAETEPPEVDETDVGEVLEEDADDPAPAPSPAVAEESERGEEPGPAPTGAEADAETGGGNEDEDEDGDEDGNEDRVDDAVILDDDGSSVDRGHGEWPGAGADGDADPDPTAEAGTTEAVDDGTTVVSGGDGWPDPDGEDEGFDAEPGDGTASDVTFGGGLTPEETAGGDATNGTAAAGGGTAAGKQFVAAEEVEPVTGDRTDGETEFFCPNCGHSRTAGGSSMRAGDICPDCHQGYIAEREG